MSFSSADTAALMKAERDRFVALAFCWGDLLLELDADRVVRFAAGATQQLLGRTAGQVLGQPVETLVTAEDQRSLQRMMRRAERQGRIDGEPLRLIGGNGEPTPACVAGYQLRDLRGHFFLALRSAADGSGGDLRTDRHRDPETGALDHGSFVNIVRDHITSRARADDEAMTFVAMDDFDRLQARLSEPAREQLLARVGDLLRAEAIDPALIGRVRQDRFALVHTSGADLGELQTRLKAILRQADPANEPRVMRGTIGLDPDGLNDTQLADGLVYAINRFRSTSGAEFSLNVLGRKLSAIAEEAILSIQDLKTAIFGEDFSIAFQPIIDAAKGKIHHFEVLTRFAAEPAEQNTFEQVCLAEQTGLITDLDLAVMRKSLHWLRTKTSSNSRTRIAVNVSGRSINSTRFLEQMYDLLTANPWSQQRLLFEITESSRVENLEMANDFVQALRAPGYEMCLDDFGAGASNFQYLSKLEVDFVKIDGGAVRQATRGRKGKAFLSALVHLCNQLGVRTVAEMIEDERMLGFVRDCDISMVQGYLFGKPSVDISDFNERDIQYLFRVAVPRPLMHGRV